MPLWAWIVFYVLVFIMLIADLKMFGKKGQHEVKVKEALQMTAVFPYLLLVFIFFSFFSSENSNVKVIGWMLLEVFDQGIHALDRLIDIAIE